MGSLSRIVIYYDFKFINTLIINYLLYKKVCKVLSTYTDGLFLQSDKHVIEDPNTHVMIREADDDEPWGNNKK